MKRTLLPLALLLPLCLASCGEKATPVAQLEVTPKKVRLPYPELHSVHLTWQPSLPLEGFTGTPTVFVHLLDQDRKVVRTFDHPYPGHWRQGEPVSYDLKLYQSTLAPPLPGGSYSLTLGLAGSGKQRWAIDGLGDPVARMEYLAAEIEVPAPAKNKKSGPRFTFSEQWLPPEPGADRQLIARRWLSGSGGMGGMGGLRVAGLRQPGSIWLVLRIPEPKVAGNLKVSDGGVPSVRIEGSCGGYEASISGPGVHEVEMPVADPPKNGMCRLNLTPNFQFGSGGPRSVSLENASWSPWEGGRPKPTAESPTAP
jgi:hypothetical protein